MSYPRVYVEGWAAFEAFRRLGFGNEEIVLVIGTSPEHGPDTLHVQLAAQDKTFTYVVSPIDRPFEDAVALWKQMFEEIATGVVGDAALSEMWKGAAMADLAHFATLVLLLQQKGFRIPALEN